MVIRVDIPESSRTSSGPSLKRRNVVLRADPGSFKLLHTDVGHGGARQSSSAEER